MVFETGERVKFGKCPLKGVICQIRFPNMLIINAEEPTKFQVEIKDQFPKYELLIEEQDQFVFDTAPNTLRIPKLVQNRNKNHKFSSSSGDYSVNLTSTFISLSTNKYTTWDDFSTVLKKVVSSFIKIYEPAFYIRIGLRYIDAFNEKDYKINSKNINKLFAPYILGIMASPVVTDKIKTFSNSAEITLSDKMLAKILVTKGFVENETQSSIILDTDIILSEQANFDDYIDKLNNMHAEASGVLRWAVKEKMIKIMEPTDII